MSPAYSSVMIVPKSQSCRQVLVLVGIREL